MILYQKYINYKTMEVIETKLVFKDKESNLTLLYYKSEAIVLKGDKVSHFRMDKLDDVISLGLYLDDIIGEERRKEVMHDLLEEEFQYELQRYNTK